MLKSWNAIARFALVAICLATVTGLGCKPKNDTPPPSGEAVTTDPLSIELPAGGDAKKGAEAAKPEGAAPEATPAEEAKPEAAKQ
jgi:hypothetical protein